LTESNTWRFLPIPRCLLSLCIEQQGPEETLKHWALLADKKFVVITVAQKSAKEQALLSLSKLPPFSPTLNRLLATLSREDVSFAKIADLIEKDAVLSGNILNLVNSAAYGRPGRVNSVRHAVSLLGMGKLRNAALSMSITSMWAKARTPAGWAMGDFNQHAIAVALLSDLIAQEAPVDYAEGAFVAGLLHDMGKLLVAIALPDAYVELQRICSIASQAPSQSEIEVLGCTLAEMSAEALKAWNLPEPIQNAVRFCNEPARDEVVPVSGHYRLSAAVRAADQYATAAGIPVQSSATAMLTTAREYLDPICGEAADHVVELFTTEFEAIRAFF
jgi:HD-like signal output (HDOD) protein